jgi:PAS domain S-box-containing protein
MNFTDSLSDSVEILESRIGIQNLINQISSKFINCPFDMVDFHIEESLRKIGTFSKVDRVYILDLSENNELTIIHEWNRTDFSSLKPVAQLIPLDIRFWNNQKENLAQPLSIGNLNEINDESLYKYIEILHKYQINSILITPLLSFGQIVGFISLLSSRIRDEWDTLLIKLLKTTGEIFVSSLNKKKYEEEQQKQEIKFQNLFNNMQNGVAYHRLILDENHNPIDYMYLDVNPAYCEMTGKPRSSLIGKRISEISMHFKTAKDNYLENFYKVAIDGINLTYEHYSPSINKWFLVNTYSPELEHFISIFSDITNQKEAEQKVKKSEGAFREVLEYSSDAAYKVDYTKKQFVYLSSVIESLVGYSAGEFTYERFHSLVHPDDFFKNTQRFHAIVKHNPLERIPIQMEYRIKCLDGKYRWIGDNFTLVKEGQKELYSIGNFRDINERKKSEMLIFESEKKFREVLELSEDVIYRYNIIAKRFEYISPKVKQLMGYSAEEFIHSKFSEILAMGHPEDMEKMTVQIQAELNKSSPPSTINLQYRILNKQKKLIWVNENRTYLRNQENEIVSFIGVIRDITDRLETEKERLRADKIESIGLLAAGIAHDFNNILVSVLGNINLLQMTRLDSEQIDILEDLEKGAYQASSLTKQLLTFSKGGKPIKKVSEIAKIVSDSVSFVLRGSNCRADVSTQENLPLVDMDAGQINQVLNNLIINADQAMPNGGVIQINVKTIKFDENTSFTLGSGEFIKIEVIDTGKGIPIEVRDRIFKPYFTTKSKGNGLGLATCYSIIKHHNGYINFETQLEKGTNFFFYLPVSKSQEKFTDQQESDDRGLQLTGGKIIVLDDDPNIHKLLTRLFTKLNIQMDLVFDGSELVNKYQKAAKSNNPYDVVIMDLTIPGGMGGKEAIQKIKQINPDVKAIVSSGYSNDPIMANYSDFGFCDVLPKPFTIQEIKALIAKYI